MGTGVGEADLNAARSSELVEDPVAVVGDGCAPAQGPAVGDNEVEQCISRLDAALVGDRAERLTGSAKIGTGNNLGAVQLAVPHPGSKLLGELFAEAATIDLAGQQ